MQIIVQGQEINFKIDIREMHNKWTKIKLMSKFTIISGG